ncbi:DUF2207 domain-containing protein [Enemella dayhoffiae]|nr:DUF2207 domain-containing protein [Enemella dayhoffiae]
MVRRRWRRPLTLLGLVLLLGLLATSGWVAAPRAYAAAGDSISNFDISYTVNPDGTVRATEKIVYNFGGTGRHGIDRMFVTREKYDDKQDAVYEYDNFSVTSPTGAPTGIRTSENRSGSDAKLQVRIGDPNLTVDRSETYQISYTVRGAMRTFTDYDEFYWDSTGFDTQAPIRRATVTVTVPGGAQDTSCFAGPPGASTECQQKSVTGAGAASFSQSDLAAGSGLTVGAKIRPGLVANPRPILQENSAASGQRMVYGGLAATGVSAVVAPLLGWLYWRRRGTDDRYLGLAPGTTPARGQQVPVGRSPKVNIPVAFSPPRIPVGEAGLLIDGSMDVQDTTATLIDLAVRGAISLGPDPQHPGGRNYQATLVDPSVTRAPHENVLLNALFHGRPPGAVAALGARGSMARAHELVSRAVQNQVTQRGWFRRLSTGSGVKLGAGCFWAVAMMAIGLFSNVLSGALIGLAALLPLAPIVATVLIVRGRMRRGQRTAEGRAVCDQVEGFQTYLATAEANQLRFEEGEDIFSKYLPWAIMFGLAERWAKLCGELVAAGRLPNTSPAWYYGDFSTFNIIYLGSALQTAATPMPSPSTGSSGSGFGGGSSFGGGGFSGGGGGGGGVGSW